MTETTTTASPTGPPEAAPADSDDRVHPSDILLHVVVAFLVPMFYEASGRDLYFARMAAIETVTSYRAHTHADLIAIAQIVAYGLAALASLGTSLADTISISMALRLRGNANACSRSAEHNRRALEVNRPDKSVPPFHTLSDTSEPVAEVSLADAAYEAVVIASVAESQKRVAEAQARMRTPQPASIVPATAAPIATPAAPTPSTTAAPAATTPAPATPSRPIPAARPTPTAKASANPTERQMQSMWAAAMTDVAGEFTASLPHLPPSERKLVSRRAAALSSCANQLIAGTVPRGPGQATSPRCFCQVQPDSADTQHIPIPGLST
jgi:hypothetical protein